MKKEVEYAEIVLAVRNSVMDVSNFEEEFEYNLDIYLEGIKADVLETVKA